MKEFIFVNTKFRLINVINAFIKEDIQGHSHSKNSFELHYIADGKGTLNTQTETFPLYKGVFYVTGPEIWHQQLTDKENPLLEYCIYFQNVENAKDLISEIFINHSFYFTYKNENIRYAFEKVIELQNNNNIFIKQKQMIYIQLIMSELAGLYAPSIINSDKFTPEDRKNVIIEDAFLYDYRNITLTSLSERLGVSERQTQRLIKKYYGKTFAQKKTEARIEKAQLLLDQNKTINEIAREIGYSDASAFEKSYKKFFGKTPKQR